METVQMSPEWFFPPPVYLTVLHSLQTCPELFEHCAVIAPALGELGKEKPYFSRRAGDTVGMLVPGLLQTH